ncbi:asparaginase [Gemmatimonadota bacterium]
MVSKRMIILACLLTTVMPWQGIDAQVRGGVAREEGAVKPRVVVLATGGTIASRAGSSTQVSGYSIGFTGDQLLEMIPGVEDIAEVTVEQFSNIASGSMTVERWISMSNRITELLEGPDDYDGVVVTHGTDTLDETAFFLHLTVKSFKPVVCTGAMRPSSSVSADGPMNLYNSIRLAAEPAAHGMGVMVMLNDEINSAREVYKSDTHRVETFQSGALGFLGWVDSDGVVFYRKPLRRHTADSEFNISDRQDLPRVDIVYTYIGVDEYAVKGFVEAGAKGLIIEGVGAGGTPSSFRAASRSIRDAGIVTVSGSRTPDGRVTGGVDTLPGHKARILLMLALTLTDDPGEIRRIFAEY